LPEIIDEILSSGLRDKDLAINNAKAFLNQYKEFMNQKDLSEHMRDFWSYTEKLDRVRGESFEQVDPVLFNLLKDY
jgi:hypothetical protein